MPKRNVPPGPRPAWSRTWKATGQARAQVALDQASVHLQHQAALDATQINLGYTSIVAPGAG